jgi:protein-L-isoaspartate(D-aspartate) O-methyltransferase
MAQTSLDQPVIDFETARNLMVDGQVRPNKVNDRRIIAAMRSLPRERFVPTAQAPLAYSDEDVPLGGGRFLTEPMVIGRMVQVATPRAGDRALVVAAGSGYATALLAACGVSVTALEEDAALLAMARPLLAEFAPTASLVEGVLAEGWASGAPYDIILVDGAAPMIPPALVAQLAPTGGRIVWVKSIPGTMACAMIGERVGDALASQEVFDCAIPPLPSLRLQPGFVF